VAFGLLPLSKGQNMKLKTFKFKEGTVIAEVSQGLEFDMKAGTITETGKFTATLVGGTAPDIKPTAVKNARKTAERIFRSEEAAFEAAFELAVKMGYRPTSKTRK
jgi:hypothetical protein